MSHELDNIVSLWLGDGWYAPRQENGAIMWHFVTADQDPPEDTKSLGLGTPEWLTTFDVDVPDVPIK